MGSDGTVSNPGFARFYSWLSRRAEPVIGRHREQLVAGLEGRVVELGSGNGLTFAHYPVTVSEVVAVEPEPTLRAEAERRAAQAPVPVRVVDALAGSLPFGDASFDAGVVSLVLCSVPDQAAALADLRRVIRPGGELRFMEHVRARNPAAVAVQRAVDATFWPRVFGGCHTARDTLDAIGAAGFDVSSVRRTFLPAVPVSPSSPHVIGAATRP